MGRVRMAKGSALRFELVAKDGRLAASRLQSGLEFGPGRRRRPGGMRLDVNERV